MAPVKKHFLQMWQESSIENSTSNEEIKHRKVLRAKRKIHRQQNVQDQSTTASLSDDQKTKENFPPNIEQEFVQIANSSKHRISKISPPFERLSRASLSTTALLSEDQKTKENFPPNIEQKFVQIANSSKHRISKITPPFKRLSRASLNKPKKSSVSFAGNVSDKKSSRKIADRISTPYSLRSATTPERRNLKTDKLFFNDSDESVLSSKKKEKQSLSSIHENKVAQQVPSKSKEEKNEIVDVTNLNGLFKEGKKKVFNISIELQGLPDLFRETVNEEQEPDSDDSNATYSLERSPLISDSPTELSNSHIEGPPSIKRKCASPGLDSLRASKSKRKRWVRSDAFDLSTFYGFSSGEVEKKHSSPNKSRDIIDLITPNEEKKRGKFKLKEKSLLQSSGLERSQSLQHVNRTPTRKKISIINLVTPQEKQRSDTSELEHKTFLQDTGVESKRKSGVGKNNKSKSSVLLHEPAVSPIVTNLKSKPRRSHSEPVHSTPLDLGSARKKPVSKVRAVPDFARIHQKAFEKMEDLEQYQKRKEDRAKLLLSGCKALKTQTPKAKVGSEFGSPAPSKNRKQLRFAVFTPKQEDPFHIPLPSTPKPSYKLPIEDEDNSKTKLVSNKSKNDSKSLWNSKIPIPTFHFGTSGTEKCNWVESKIKENRKEMYKNAVSKNPKRQDVREKRREIIKGVRSNRRFEMMMDARKKKEEKEKMDKGGKEKK